MFSFLLDSFMNKLEEARIVSLRMGLRIFREQGADLETAGSLAISLSRAPFMPPSL